MSLSRPSPSGDWKAIQHDYDEIFALSDDIEYFQLSKRDQALLLSVVEMTKWVTRWYSSGDIDRDAVAALVAKTIERLMSPIGGTDVPFQLRQNEETPCLLEQSLDGGTSWSIAFDYSKCQQFSATDYNFYLNIVYQNNSRREELYDGTPDSVNENCPTDYFTGGGNPALCSALKHYVEIQILDTLNRYRVAAGLAALAAGALGLGGGILGIVVGGIVAGLVGYALSEIEAAANDRDAINDVICELLDLMDGVAISEANFVASLNSLGAGTGNGATIVDILKGNKGNQANYLWFIDLLGEAVVATSTGYDDCPCSDEWCWNFDFTADNGSWVNVPGTSYGVYSSGVGWVGTKVGTVYTAYLRRLFDTRVLTKAYITVNCPGGITPGANVVLFNGASTVLLNSNLLLGNHTYVWEGEATSGELRVNPNDTTVNFQMTSITLWGRGENPFGEDNC